MAATSVAAANRFPLVVKIQVVVAVVAVAITIAAGFRLVPILERKQQLETDVRKLEAELSKLTADKTALAKEVEAGEEVGVQAIARVQAANGLPDTLRGALRDAPRGFKLTPRPVQNRTGYVVILGSYRKVANAVNDLPGFRQRTGEQVELFWSVNGYFANAVGTLRTREEASSKQQQLRSVVKDAYVFGTWALPYSIDIAAQ